MLITLKLLASQENLEQFCKTTTFGTPKMCNSNKAGFYWLPIEIIEISLHKHTQTLTKIMAKRDELKLKLLKFEAPFQYFLLKPKFGAIFIPPLHKIWTEVYLLGSEYFLDLCIQLIRAKLSQNCLWTQLFPLPLKWLLKASLSFFPSHTLLLPWLGLAQSFLESVI